MCLIKEAAAFLRPYGHLLFEFGEDQSRQVKALIDRTRLYPDARFAADSNGEQRVAIVKSR